MAISQQVSLMEKKIFWILFTVLGTLVCFVVPNLWLGLVLQMPLIVLCWWIVYKSGWFN